MPSARRRTCARLPRTARHALAAVAAAALTAPLILAASTPPAGLAGEAADKGEKLARRLVGESDARSAGKHLRKFRSIAEDSGGNRAAGTRGHARSAKYAGGLLEKAGYEVTYQDFEFIYRETLAEKLTVLTPEKREIPVRLMSRTKNTSGGGLRAALARVPAGGDDSPGCEAGDYGPAGVDGRIALIRRGGCTFTQKQDAAADAGAVGALIYNNVRGELSGAVGKSGEPGRPRIPTGGISESDGEALAGAAAKARPGEGRGPSAEGPGSGTGKRSRVTVDLELRETAEKRRTPNVIAETRGGDPDRVVMLGAHLDSVPQGPGINDNASGVSGILEAARHLSSAEKKGAEAAGNHPNKIRFALWSAEETGLKGSEYYVGQLSRAARDRISLYLNFDMIASPNYGLFVYDGDNSDGEATRGGPAGSGRLEGDIRAFMASQGHRMRGTPFDGRSDYVPFVKAGIPSGGALTGAEEKKTPSQEKLWGGRSKAPYDSCYHRACDGLKNIDRAAFDANLALIADAVGRYAWNTGDLPRRN